MPKPARRYTDRIQKTQKLLVDNNIRRHTDRDKEGNATEEGIRRAFNLGKKIAQQNKGGIFIGDTSSTRRARVTLEAIERAYKDSGGRTVDIANKGGKVVGKTADGKDMKFNVISEGMGFSYENYGEVMKLLKDYGDFNKLKKDWYAGKIPTRLIMPPKELADTVIKDRIGGVLNYILSKPKKSITDLTAVHMENITHDYLVDVVFYRLTGKTMNLKDISPRSGLNFKIYSSKRGDISIIMDYKSKVRLNVTKQIFEICGLKR